jgi:hypothetical protein
LGVASLRISIFNPRYVISTVPLFLIALLSGIDTITDYLRRWINIHRIIIVIVMLMPWFMISAMTINNYHTNPSFNKSNAWDELADFLHSTVSANDLVIQLSTDSAFGYYYHGVADDRGLPASPQQPASEIIEILESASNQYDSLYVVSNAISSWQNADVVETWANENMQLVRLSNASGLGIRQYKNWDVDSTKYESVLTTFDNSISLVGFELFSETLPTGEIVLWVYWKPTAQTNMALKSFVHLVGDDGLMAQDDQFPQDGRLDATKWETEVIYRDVYYLPTDDLDSGDYQILLGWYNPADATRLNTVFGQDSYILTNMTYP